MSSDAAGISIDAGELLEAVKTLITGLSSTLSAFVGKASGVSGTDAFSSFTTSQTVHSRDSVGLSGGVDVQELASIRELLEAQLRLQEQAEASRERVENRRHQEYEQNRLRAKGEESLRYFGQFVPQPLRQLANIAFTAGSFPRHLVQAATYLSEADSGSSSHRKKHPIAHAVADVAKPAVKQLAVQGVSSALRGSATGAADAAVGAGGGLTRAAIGTGIAALASNPAGWAIGLVGAIIAVEAALLVLPSIVRGFAQELLDAQKRLANFSPEMASVFLNAQARDMRRDAEIGARTAASAKELADALGNLKDASKDFDVIWQNGKNEFGAGLAKLVTELARERSALAAGAAEILKRATGIDLNPNVKPGVLFQERLRQHAFEEAARRAANDARFKNNPFNP